MILPSIVFGENQNSRTAPLTDDALLIFLSDEDEKTIYWTVAIQPEALTEQRSGVIRWSEGLTLTSISDHEAMTPTETSGLYSFDVQAQDGPVHLELTTEKIDDVPHTLTVALEVDDKTVHTQATVQASEFAPMSETVEVKEREQEQTTDEQEDLAEEEEEVDEPDAESDDQQEVDELKQDEESTDDTTQELDGQQTDEQTNESEQEDAGFTPYTVPFTAGNATQQDQIASTGEWPAPGSIQLDKMGTPTENYAEWEVELTVEGKNVQRTSDIVLVFDRSNSMLEGNRLRKAKDAAIEFVEEILIEGSPARMSLVSFGLSHTLETNFVTHEQKQSIINRIEAIQPSSREYPEADGGTNIQAGLHQAYLLLQGSNADLKTIVLLSDGEPTASFRARNATSYGWPNGKYTALLSNFNYNQQVGTGHTYELTECSRWDPFCSNPEQYSVNGHTVRTHGIATLSEAKHVMDSGIDLYSVGLEVGSNANAQYVLEHSQNSGYYSGGSDDMSTIFDEIAAHIANAGTDAVVTDPLGEMFNLVEDGSYAGAHVEASHGTVTWNAETETFTWEIGPIREGETYTLTYKVTIDWEKDPEGDVFYPLNQTTPLNYKDHEGHPQVKQFPIPEGKIEDGRIVTIGYRVNLNEEPVDADGNVVDSIAEAETFYVTTFTENGTEKLPFWNSYHIYPEAVSDYTLLVGDHPKVVDISPTHPFSHVYFGYVKTSELTGGTVTATYVNTDGEQIAQQEVFTGFIGESYETEQKEIAGYTFVEIDPTGAEKTGTFKIEEQEVIYIYEKNLGSVHITKVDPSSETTLAGAQFEIQSTDGEVIATGETNDEGQLIFADLDWGTYTIVETKAPTGYRLLEQPLEIVINADEQMIELTIENTKQDWEIPDTGGSGPLGFYMAGILIFMSGMWLAVQRFLTRGNQGEGE